MHGAITLLEIKIKNLPQIEKLICQLMHGAITVLDSWSKMTEEDRRQLRTYRNCGAFRAAG